MFSFRLRGMAFAMAAVPALLFGGSPGLEPGAPAVAADWPTKPVTIMIGYRAGGSTDTIGRVLGKVLGAELGQKVNVINKPGAGGAVAAAYLMNQKPDGYLIYMSTTTTIAVAPLMQKAVKYNIDSFDYGPFFHAYQNALMVPSAKPYRNLMEFIAYAKKNQPVKYAVYNETSKMVMQFISNKFDFKVSYIPVKGGAGAIPLIMGEKVDISPSGGLHAKYTHTGKVRVLASTNSERLPAYPDQRTLMEDGIDISLDAMTVMAFPKGTPQPIIDKVDAALKKAHSHPDIVKILDKVKQPAYYVPNGAAKARLQQIQSNASKMIKAVGYKPK